MNRSVPCPNISDHKGWNGQYVKKTLIIVGPDCVYSFCKKHGWMKIEFWRDGKKLDFSTTTIKISEVSQKYIPNVEATTVSVGRFGKKPRNSSVGKCRKS